MHKLSNLKIKSNYVLIKPEKDIEQLKSGLLVMAGKEDKQKQLANTEARHYNITGTVLIAPETLIYRGRQINELKDKTNGKFGDDDLKILQSLVNGSMEYKTEIEVQAGDKVWFDYLVHINAHTQSRTIEVEGHGECILVEYSRLFIREREGKRIPINGWIFIKKVVAENKSMFLLADTANQIQKNVAEVFQVGSPIEEYLSIKYSDHYFKNVKAGDKILYNERLATPLEYSIHETEGLESLYKIKRTDIKAIITDSEMVFDSQENSNFRIAI